MGRLDWDIVLDLTRELIEWQIYGSPRQARAALRERYDEDRWLRSGTTQSSSSRRRWSLYAVAMKSRSEISHCSAQRG